MRLGLPWRSDTAPRPRVTPARFEQTSIALEYVLDRLEDAPRPGVLDLGGPVASNLELYARHRARVTFADFYRFYEPERPKRADANDFSESIPRTAHHVDIILAWDLLNYLSLDEIGWLLANINETRSPGAVLLALVACAGSIPATVGTMWHSEHWNSWCQDEGPRWDW